MFYTWVGKEPGYDRQPTPAQVRRERANARDGTLRRIDNKLGELLALLRRLEEIDRDA